MKKLNYRDCDCKICGIKSFEEHGEFRRLPEEITDKIESLRDAGRRVPGGRVLFRTDSKRVGVRIGVDNVYVDRGISFYEANVGAAFVGERKNARFAGIITADNTYESRELSIEFDNDGLNDITVFLPRNPTVTDINIFVDDDAEILPPTSFEWEKPFVFYGSSITECGHCAVQYAYSALLAREFDADFYNFGFSGAARGEKEMAEFLSEIDMSLFVYDYDHNAPDPEHLRKTHYDFYKVFREKRPEVPVIMMTRPAADDPTTDERREIVRESFERGLAEGDKNLYFIDGRELFCGVSQDICTTDRTHPNDLGHYLMYKRVEKTVKEIFNI